jgi:hypothetical protein
MMNDLCKVPKWSGSFDSCQYFHIGAISTCKLFHINRNVRIRCIISETGIESYEKFLQFFIQSKVKRTILMNDLYNLLISAKFQSGPVLFILANIFILELL